VHLLAYNLVRELMLRAAQAHDAHPRLLSFKHDVQTWLAWHARDTDPDEHEAELLNLLVQRRVGRRPGRIEPRRGCAGGRPWRGNGVHGGAL
jgi:hypothetical protein